MREVNKKTQQTGIAKVVLYGSKASRTSLKSDDIDMLIVAPTYVDRYPLVTQQGSLFRRFL
jgi:predicted nucleotidyltransferase